MDFVLSVIYGITIKVYDDITDTGIPVSPLLLEVLKTLQTITLTITTYSDFNYAFIYFILNVFSMVADKTAYLSDDYYRSVLYLYPIFLIYNFNTRKWFSVLEILCLLWFAVMFGVEPLIIKENVSNRKFIFRSIGIVGTVCGIFTAFYLGLSSSILKLIFAWLGYVTTSSIFQGYMLIKNNDISTSSLLHG